MYVRKSEPGLFKVSQLVWTVNTVYWLTLSQTCGKASQRHW